jgi:hypothetical protein
MKKILTLLFVSMIVFSCTDDIEVDEGCSTPATVKDLTGLDGCGFVFELEDGTRLEPQRIFFCGTPPLPKEAIEDPLYNFQFVDGKKVLIDYEELDGAMSICMAGPVVRITCLKEVTTKLPE